MADPTSFYLVNLLVPAGKLSIVKATAFLEMLTEHHLSMEDLQITPSTLLVEYLSQPELGLSLVEKIHLSVLIKSNNNKVPLDTTKSPLQSTKETENSNQKRKSSKVTKTTQKVPSVKAAPSPRNHSSSNNTIPATVPAPSTSSTNTTNSTTATTSTTLAVATTANITAATLPTAASSSAASAAASSSTAGSSTLNVLTATSKSSIPVSQREKKPKKITDAYEILDLIGKGGFSEVRKGRSKKTLEIVAIKMIEKKQHPEKIENVKREIELMKKLNHKNIVCLKDVFEDEGEDGKIFMVMEYASGGELFDHIVNRGNYSEQDAALVVKQIIEAVYYLHSNNIAHRDLKPENLLCTGSSNDIIKVADFGLSKEFDSGVRVLETMCGTPDYVAPEVLRGFKYTPAVDIWSIGVVTYVMLCGSPPFYGADDREVFLKILAVDYRFFSPEWDTISTDAKEFISKLLVLEPNNRPTAEQCLEAPWIKNAAMTGQHLLNNEKFSTNIKNHTTHRRRAKNPRK